jgi:hypothetical protein
MKRRAYIGLSSPTAYFYDHGNKYFDKEPWHWNPILESLQGLITLFDELWFLSRSLCPVSLRKENYVKFLDEDSDYIPLINGLTEILNSNSLDGIVQDNAIIDQYIDIQSDYTSEQFKRYSQVIENVYGRQPDINLPIDNHSHAIDLCGFGVRGNSMRIDLLAYDISFLSRAGIRNIELVTNRFNNAAFKTNPTIIKNIQVAQSVIIKRIPFLQTPSGPIINRIEAIRESNFLVDFRNKILNSENPENLVELVANIEDEFEKYRNDVLLQLQIKSRIGTSIAKNACSLIVGTIIPGVGEIKSLISDAETRKFSWTGFLADIERNL